MTQFAAQERRGSPFERDLALHLSDLEFDLHATEVAMLALAVRVHDLETAIGRQPELDPTLDGLNRGLHDVRERIEALRSAGGDSWESLRSGVQDALGELRRGIADATTTSR